MDERNKDGVLGLPPGVWACLFDLDGVLTQTAKVHAAAWKETFDAFLKARAQASGTRFVPFDEVKDYEQYVDGKPRDDGTRSFLASRGVTLPDTADGDDAPPSGEGDFKSVEALGTAKNNTFNQLLKTHGVEVFDGSIRYVRAARAAGLHTAVVTSSANCSAILKAAGITDLFETTVDGNDVKQHGLKGKPAPDTFLAGAKALGAEPHEAVVYEDALAGVEAGRAGKFGRVIGVDRLDQAEALREHGADIVVEDLAELLDGNGTQKNGTQKNDTQKGERP